MYIFLILIIYIITRTIELLRLPIFIDEALYIRWIETIVSGGWNSPLISLNEDGQPPIFFLLAAAVKSLSHIDSLLLIRIISIFFGGITLWFGMKLVQSITKKKTSSAVFALLYLTSPFILMYDRLGMRDSAISCALVATLYFLHKKRWLLAGICIAAGIGIKSTAWFVPPLAALYIWLTHTKTTIKTQLLILLPTLLIVSSFFFTHTLHQTMMKNTIFITSPVQLGAQIRNNLYQTIMWFWQYLHPVVFVAIFLLVAYQFLEIKKRKTQWTFLILAAIPLLISIGMAKIYFPRYILLSVILLFIHIAINWHKPIIVAVLCLFPAFWSYRLITDPATAPLPQIEQWQYISGWPAGYGVKETATFLTTYQPDLILTESTDLLRTGLIEYQPQLASIIQVISTTPLNSTYCATHKVVLALHLSKEVPIPYNGTKLFEYQKPNLGDKIVVYAINN